MKEEVKRTVVKEDTRWECQKCMKCCRTNKDMVKKIFDIHSDKDECPFLENNKCKIESKKPLICKLYPFFPGITEEEISFAIGKLTVFLACPGLGKGKKISENKELLKEIDDNAKDLMERLALKSQGEIKDVFEEKKELAS